MGAAITVSPSTIEGVAGVTDGAGVTNGAGATGSEDFGKEGIIVEVVPEATSTRYDCPSTSIRKLLLPVDGNWTAEPSTVDITVIIKGDPFTTT